MITLKDILYRVSINKVIGNTNVAITNVEFDSRKVSLNDVFVATRGTVSDGHEYIKNAVNQGAIAIVCEELPKDTVNGVTYVKVQNAQQALAFMASNFYENPSENLQLVGVTGTNGKTTIASLLYQLYTKAGFKVGLLSTVKIMVGNIEYKATHTTPDSLTINKYLSKMTDIGCEYCFMEVSSHGIAQHRTTGLKFTLTNADDKNGIVMLQNTKAKKQTYALKSIADYKAQILENQFSGLLLKLNNNELWSKLIGNFNAYNLLAIFATTELLGMQTMESLRLISELESVNGRFQYLIKNKITAIVDYAHTPDALKNVLETINAIRTKNEELITVVGCGGDRDATKRPKMGHIASALSTKVIFTSDNPRTEDPNKIIEAIESGVEPQHFKKTLSIADRKQAIKTACSFAKENDIILIAGKGHETYQEINGERTDFDDFKIVKTLLTQLNN